MRYYYNSLVLFIVLFLVVSCDDSKMMEIIKYLNRPQQRITNVQVVSINRLELSLSFDVAQDSFTTSDITITDSQGNVLSTINIQFNDTQPDLVILETEFLSPNERYTINIQNIHSTSTLNTPQGGLTFNFVTTDFPDNTPPILLSYCIQSEEDYCFEYNNGWPEAGIGIIYPFSGVQLVFDEPMEPSTVQLAVEIKINQTSLTIEDGEWTNFKQQVVFPVDTDSIRKQVTLSLTASAKDARGNALSNPLDSVEFYLGDPEGADDFEPDDTFAQATPIELNRLYFATLHAESDVDFFQIDLNQSTPYLLVLDNMPEGTDYDLTCYYSPDYGSQVTDLIPYQVDYEKYLFIPALSGEHTYYLEVSSSLGYSITDYYALIVMDYESEQDIYFKTTTINSSNQDSVELTILGGNSSDIYSFNIVSDGSIGGSSSSASYSDTVATGELNVDVSDIYDGTLSIENFTLSTGSSTSDPIDGLNTAYKDTQDIISPENDNWTAGGVINPGANIITTFSEPMLQSTVENISSYTVSESKVTITNVAYNPVNDIATFTVSYYNTDGTETYTITPSTDITDLAGNPLDPLISNTYTTIDTLPPPASILVEWTCEECLQQARDVEATATYLYVVDYYRGLQIYNISDPANPAYEGKLDLGGDGEGLTLSGSYAFIAEGTGGFSSVDVSDPTAPTMLDNISTTDAQDVYVSGNYAYVADGDGGLRIVDISSPSALSLEGTWSRPAVNDVYVSGNYAYCANTSPNRGIQIADVSAPSSPTLIGEYNSRGYYESVFAFTGFFAYCASQYTLDSLDTFDISTPNSPSLETTTSVSNDPKDLYYDGNYLFFAHTDGITILDIDTAPNSPSIEGTFDTFDYACNVHANNNYAFVADQYGGVHIIDVSNASAPSLTSVIPTVLNFMGIYVSGNYVYASDNSTGLKIIDISTPSSPSLVGSYYTGSNGRGIIVDGNAVYIAQNNDGFEVVNVSDPANPTSIATVTPTGSIYNIDIDSVNDYAYVAAGSGGMYIYDVSLPSSPSEEANFTTTDTANDVLVEGNYAYIANDNDGILIVDITTPSAPSLVGSEDSYDARAVYLQGDYLYVADGSEGLKIFDVSTPSSPTLVGNQDLPTLSDDVFVVGNYAFVAYSFSIFGMSIIDVSDPENPWIIDSVTTTSAESLYIDGDYAYIADGNGILTIVDVSGYIE